MILVVEPGIEERRRAVHLCARNVGVPVGDRPEAGPGGQVHTGQAERGRDERSRLLSVGVKGLAVFVQFRVVATGPSAGENLLYGVDIDAKEVSERLEVRCQRHDSADV